MKKTPIIDEKDLKISKVAGNFKLIYKGKVFFGASREQCLAKLAKFLSQ